MNHYWNERFRSEGMIWGSEPSPTAEQALEWFNRYGVRSVLVPGAGYGRNTKRLSSVFQVDGIELSPEAVALGREWDPATCFVAGSVLDMPFSSKRYEGIYAYDVLHLFTREDRQRMMQGCVDSLACGGLLYATVFSDEDAHCGIGQELEPGTYEYKPGKVSHFFGEQDLIQHAAGLTILDTGKVEEVLQDPGGGTHSYQLRYLVAQKPE